MTNNSRKSLRRELDEISDFAADVSQRLDRATTIGCQLIDALEYVEKINPELVREARLSAGLAIDPEIEAKPFNIKSNYSRFVISTTPIILEDITADRLNKILEWVYSSGAKAVLRKYGIENVQTS